MAINNAISLALRLSFRIQNMDEACQSLVESSFAKAFRIPSTLILLFLASFDFCLFVVIFIKSRRLRSMQIKNFSMIKYLCLLGGGMMFLSISNFIFGISNYLAQAGIKSLDVLSLNFGNPYFAAYQLMYSTGTCLPFFFF